MPRTPDTSPQTLRVFTALLADPTAWRYGYDLSRETKLASGTLYPILMRLADRELLETRWEEAAQPGRPARHTYRLTSDGAALAHERLGSHSNTQVQPTPRPSPQPQTGTTIRPAGAA
ncbi:PadR family transcriptional regulator [Micromonospora polyrhachis]|uniref:DNA-binding PadR family transcriptional regulator n=1 Tax=Micromonospora polyrhachis TaxID=1282883 RepID=A0A7W7SU75_9ACTN|nr:PadR family transcriptional regulator [Micromonospora polyrhachis]MBB4961075.1 DNA-binding PadR family transcriptional regulator [Micromonospora polyrhachis]